ncbi:hypothetical protein BDA99DRAFT_498072 [Phascolomyces articulosus]|uniref:Uncharacterized protein n=1 Tax=Phascolomyces articulosus TaxID=60185 RepID=A0AAD5PK01_9FUNG|nr:hypothetical protein BDA99DRAFT_498072 [Phascolomyces articulosus]
MQQYISKKEHETLIQQLKEKHVQELSKMSGEQPIQVEMAPTENISDQQEHERLRQEHQKTMEALHVAQNQVKETNEQHKQRIIKMTDAHAQVLAGLQEQLKNTEAKKQKEILLSSDTNTSLQSELETMATSFARMAELLECKEDNKDKTHEVILTKNGNYDPYGAQPTKNNVGNAVSQERQGQLEKEFQALQATFQRLMPQLTSYSIDHDNDQQDKTGFAEHRPQQSTNKTLEAEVTRLEISTRRQEV